MENISNNDNNQDVSYKNRIDLQPFKSSIDKIRSEIEKVIVGQHEMIDLLITAVISDGHILIEGVPGIAKTLAAKSIAAAFDCKFTRIQFTPDLMPSDVLGTSIYNPKTTEFDFKSGPIFTNIALIDEINRAPAKTQAALFEVMEERQVSIAGDTYHFEAPFLVIATQNPIEHEGTYRLPEAQIDRFLFKIVIDYPKPSEELKILDLKSKGNAKAEDINKVIDKQELMNLRKITNEIFIEQKILKYIVDIVTTTRNHPALYLGASPRASIALLNASKAFAAMQGRDFVIPEDIQFLAPHVLNHRIMITPEKEMEGIPIIDIIKDILQKVEVPR